MPEDLARRLEDATPLSSTAIMLNQAVLDLAAAQGQHWLVEQALEEANPVALRDALTRLRAACLNVVRLTGIELSRLEDRLDLSNGADTAIELRQHMEFT